MLRALFNLLGLADVVHAHIPKRASPILEKNNVILAGDVNPTAHGFNIGRIPVCYFHSSLISRLVIGSRSCCTFLV